MHSTHQNRGQKIPDRASTPHTIRGHSGTDQNNTPITYHPQARQNRQQICRTGHYTTHKTEQPRTETSRTARNCKHNGDIRVQTRTQNRRVGNRTACNMHTITESTNTKTAQPTATQNKQTTVSKSHATTHAAKAHDVLRAALPDIRCV